MLHFAFDLIWQTKRFHPTQRSYIAHRTNSAPGNGLLICRSVYVKNLDERVKVESLIDSLREIFSEYGNIIDIVAKKSLKRKGQAFIVYDSEESAQNAIDELTGFDLFGKQMSCEFAKTKSDATINREGTQEELEQHKRRRIAEKGRLGISFLQEQLLTRHRTQASRRSRHRSTISQARSTGPTRSRRRTSSKGLARCWSQRSWCRGSWRCTRRVSATEQDPLLAPNS